MSNQLARLKHRYSKHLIKADKHFNNENKIRAEYHLFMANQIIKSYGKVKGNV